MTAVGCEMKHQALMQAWEASRKWASALTRRRTMALHRYPLLRPPEDPRFTLGLVLDVAEVLTRRGYPCPESVPDIAALQQALFTFLYEREPAPG